MHTVRSTTLDPAPPPAAYLAGSGGIFRDCSVHDFDAVRWVTGQEAVSVYAAVRSTEGREFYADDGDWTTVRCSSPSTTGSIGVVSNTRTNARGYDVRLEVHGIKDAVAAGLDEGLPLRSDRAGRHLARPVRRTPSSWTASPRPSARELATFYRGGRRRGPLAVHPRGRHGRRVDRRGRDPVRQEHRPVRIDEVAR